MMMPALRSGHLEYLTQNFDGIRHLIACNIRQPLVSNHAIVESNKTANFVMNHSPLVLDLSAHKISRSFSHGHRPTSPRAVRV